MLQAALRSLHAAQAPSPSSLRTLLAYNSSVSSSLSSQQPQLSSEEQRRVSHLFACSSSSSTRSFASATAATPSGSEQRGPSPPQSPPQAQAQQEHAESAAAPPAGIHALRMQQARALQQQQELMESVLLQPLPVGRVKHDSLNNVVVDVNGTYFIDPAKMLESTMRLLHVVKQVLANNGYIGIINCNSAFRPLMREAALHCANPNVFWYWESWRSGLLSGKLTASNRQPCRSLLKSRGLTMKNVHCPQEDPVAQPQPTLRALHKWRLLARRNDLMERRPRTLLREILAAETRTARLPLEGSLTGKSGHLQLLINLDLSHGTEAIEEAFTHGLLTASVVNAHSPLERVTYPIYAGENHPAFQHFLLDWLLKVVNLQTPEEEAAAAAARTSRAQSRESAQTQANQSQQALNIRPGLFSTARRSDGMPHSQQQQQRPRFQQQQQQQQQQPRWRQPRQ